MLKTNGYLPLIPLFKKFISETRSGRRLQKSGKLVTESTIKNYDALLKKLESFSGMQEKAIEINVKYKYSKRNFERERRQYRKFYKQFTDYLYINCSDNYVGMLIKTLRTFFIYLNETKGYETGSFYKLFYARRNEASIIVLSQPQLQFLIQDMNFEQSLPRYLLKHKDILVFGCTIGLRFSDLLALRAHNLQKVNRTAYILTKSKKTDTQTRIKLPDYAYELLMRYKGKQKTLLPKVTLMQFNSNIRSYADQCIGNGCL